MGPPFCQYANDRLGSGANNCTVGYDGKMKPLYNAHIPVLGDDTSCGASGWKRAKLSELSWGYGKTYWNRQAYKLEGRCKHQKVGMMCLRCRMPSCTDD